MSFRFRSARHSLLGLLSLTMLATFIPPSLGSSSKVDMQTHKPASGQANRYRLPALAVPSEYELYFEPDLRKFSFSGNTVRLTRIH